MDKSKENLLEEFEVTAILVGFMIGVGILSLPNAVAKDAKQDGWIGVIVGGVYPIFMGLLSIYYIKKHPNEDILILSKKYLGTILGTICNILYMAQFGIYVISGTTGLSNIYRVYATPFLTPFKIFIPTTLLVIYLTHKGVKVLARINKISLYFSVILALTLLTALQRGNYLNLLPLFGSGYKNILKGSIESSYAYGGMEAIFLIYPIIRKKDKITAIVWKATFITMGIYTWVTFITIYYLGYKVILKTFWPVFLVTEGVNLPLLNSFRLVFIFLWSIVMLKVITDEYYAFVHILCDVLKVKEKKMIYYFTFPLIIYICLKVGNPVQRSTIMDYIIPKATIFNVVYVAIIGLLIFIKDKIGKNKVEGCLPEKTFK